jgi:hypothetical protein
MIYFLGARGSFIRKALTRMFRIFRIRKPGIILNILNILVTTGFITLTLIPGRKIRNKDVKDFKDKSRGFSYPDYP